MTFSSDQARDIAAVGKILGFAADYALARARRAVAHGLALREYMLSLRIFAGLPFHEVRPDPMRSAWLKTTGVPWPHAHPTSGFEFVTAESLDISRAHEFVRYERPPAPTRKVPAAWNEDGEPTAFRELSEKEWADALDAFRRAVAEWHQNGGFGWIAEGERISATFFCADRTWARGLYRAGKWVWLQQSLEPRPHR